MTPARGSWDLDERVAQLERAGAAWVDLSTSLEAISESIAAESQQLMGEWEGEGARSYGDHRSRLVDSLDTGASLAADAAAVVERTTGSVREARSLLDDQWATVSGMRMTERPDGSLLIYPRSRAEQHQVATSREAAAEIRSSLDVRLGEGRVELQSIATRWREIADSWRPIAEGARTGFRVFTEDTAPGLLVVDGTAIFNPGGDGQNLQDIDIGDGHVDVVGLEGDRGWVGRRYLLPPDADLVVRGAQGFSRVDAEGAPDFTFVGNDNDTALTGGPGADQIVGLGGRDLLVGGGGGDLISGGSGPDDVDGQRGSDLLIGGSGHDSLYGGPGGDTLHGDAGGDHHEGGRGDDRILGGRGTDVLSGGRDDDRLLGGADDDVAYGGFGRDRIDGGGGRGDVSYDDAAGAGISGSETAGSGTESSRRVIPVDTRSTFAFPEELGDPVDPDFRERVGDDLLLLGTSPVGQQMLDELADLTEERGVEYRIVEVSDEATSSMSAVSATEVEIEHSPTVLPDRDGPRSSPHILFHELSHARAFASGLFPEDPLEIEEYEGDDAVDHGVSTVERWAVGLPVDHDDDRATPERLDQDNPLRYTENGLLLEFGWPKREHYKDPDLE